jgi:carboxypeptidase C (cathepsin A)
MGVAYISEAQLKVYQDFLGAKLENSSSFGYKVANTLFYRVWRKLFNTDKVDFELYENFYDGITRIDELRWWEAYLIAFSNILQSSYRTMLRKKFIARAEN